MSIFLTQALRMLLLMFIQIAIFNNIYLGFGVTIYIYVFFILQLPLATPRWLMLLVSFFLGLGIDAFFNLGGPHAFASVLIAFIRPILLKFMYTPSEMENIAYPSTKTMRYNNFIRYAFFMIFVHHLAVAVLEIFNLKKLFFSLPSILVSVLLSTIVIVLIDLLKRKEKN